MKTVYLIRHAKSSWSDSSLRDIDRPLNKRGYRDAPFMAKLLRGHGVEPDLIISSPANRARTTAGYFAEELGIDKKAIDLRQEIYEAYARDIIEMIQSLPDTANTVLIFGHNPCFTSVANTFSKEYIPNIPTCGITKIEADVASWSEFDERRAKLTDFYYPKQYF